MSAGQICPTQMLVSYTENMSECKKYSLGFWTFYIFLTEAGTMLEQSAGYTETF